MGSFVSFCDFQLFLALLCHFSLVYHFSCHLLALWFFLLLVDLLELFFGFWSSSCASRVLDSKFKLCAFCVVNVIIKGEIEKPSGQYLGLIVMSNRLASV
jgi:hypothetical protein